MHSTPQLEILADDVKCKHGSTTGQLDAKALFYLRSRGIGEAEARGLLTWAFASDLVRKLAIEPLRAAVEAPPAGEPAGRGRAEASPERPAAGAPSPRFDVAAVRAGVPDPARDASTASRSSTSTRAASAQKPQAVIDAERARLRALLRERPPRRPPPLDARDRRLRGGAREGARASWAPRRRARSCSLRGTTEAINLVAQSYGRRARGRGRRGPHHRPRAPLEHRAVADAVRGEGRAAAGRADRRRGRGRPGRRSSGCSRRARGSSPSPTSRTRSARSTRSQRMSELAHAAGAVVLVDGAQAAPHLRVDVRALGCDFYAFSGHKVYGPSGDRRALRPRGAARGDAAVAGRRRHDRAPSRFEKTTWNELPYKFEAGTPEHRGRDRARRGDRLGRARSGLDAHRRPRARPARATGRELLATIPGLRLVGTAREKAGVLSFVLDGVHPHDVGTILDYEGIAIRTGHHCAQPVMDRFGDPGHDARLARLLQHARGARRARRSASARSRRCSRDARDAARAVPGGDPGPQQAAAEPPRALERATARRGRAQPAVRRPGDRLPPRRGRRRDAT